jgi:hypothetical protein
MELDPFKSLFQSENPNVESDDVAAGLASVLSEWRGISFTFGWAIAALVATGGWLYFMTRAAYFLFSGLFG